MEFILTGMCSRVVVLPTCRVVLCLEAFVVSLRGRCGGGGPRLVAATCPRWNINKFRAATTH